MSDHQTLNEQVFGDGLPMFPPHLCCCGTSAIWRASYKRQVAGEPVFLPFCINAQLARNCRRVAEKQWAVRHKTQGPHY